MTAEQMVSFFKNIWYIWHFIVYVLPIIICLSPSSASMSALRLCALIKKARVNDQGSHSDWKTWKNGKAFSSQEKVREF